MEKTIRVFGLGGSVISACTMLRPSFVFPKAPIRIKDTGHGCVDKLFTARPNETIP
ncbi:MAG: hypothetical protein WC527_08850 [Candidatus Margulisiibacteriota bacterium]